MGFRALLVILAVGTATQLTAAQAVEQGADAQSDVAGSSNGQQSEGTWCRISHDDTSRAAVAEAHRKLCRSNQKSKNHRVDPISYPADKWNCSDAHPKIWVKGHGGVGESYVMTTLRRVGYHTNDARNKDRIKHSAYKKSAHMKNDRSYHCPIKNNAMGIYVYGDPASAVKSLYRRKYHGKQCAYYGHNCSTLPKNASAYVQQVEALGEDPWLNLEAHFTSWLNNCPHLLGVELEDLADPVKQPLIAYHLRIPESALHRFAVKARSSKPATAGYFYEAKARMDQLTKRRLCEVGS
jgi:hypothetical protein